MRLFLDFRQNPEQSLHIRVESCVVDRDSLPARELAEALRQVLGLRHRCVFDQDGDDADAALERRLDLDPDEVFGVIEPAASASCRRWRASLCR